MANTRMFAVALQSKDFKEVHAFKHTVPDDYYTTNHWQANHKDVFNKSVKTKSRLNLKNIEDFQIDTHVNKDIEFYTESFKEYLRSIGNINYAT